MVSDLVQIHLPHERNPLPTNRQLALCKAVAKICDLQSNDIAIVAQKQENGLWVAINIPQPLTVKLTSTRSQAASPLWSLFQEAHASLIPLHQPISQFNPLEADDQNLLRLLYLGAKQVIVRAELGGGYSGARVLLVELIDQADKTIAAQIVKLAGVEEIAREQVRYARYIDNHLPRITPRLKNQQVWAGKAGLCYDFVDGGVLGRTKTLEHFYQAQSSVAPIIQTLSDLLVKELGEQWYRQSTPLTTPFTAAYGADLVEHLLIRIRPDSSDGIWRRGQEPALDNPYQRIDQDTILAHYADIAPGTFIQINGLVVAGAKADALRLHYPDKPGVVIKAHYPADIDQMLALAVDDTVVVRGEVIHNRQEHLEAIVLDAFFNYEAFALEKQALKLATVRWVGGEIIYPNPLHHYTNILNAMLRGRKSLVHGDLHLRNILVDETGRGYLIDFALVAERHNLFDFIKLETYIRQMILSRHEYRFTFKEYLHFEEQLTANSLVNAAITPPSNAELGKAYEVITALRKLAAQKMDQPPDWRSEYLPALFLYNLVVLKYHENHGRQATRLAFGTAAVLLKHMQDVAVDAANQPKNDLGDPPIKAQIEVNTEQVHVKIRVYDVYTPLEIGVEELLRRLDKSQPEYYRASNLQLRLDENIRKARMTGDGPLLQANRNDITSDLNGVAFSMLGVSFRDLCPKI